MGPRDETLYLVDISSFIFRAFYAIRRLTTSKGEPTNAVYGVAAMLARLQEEIDPRFLTILYDSREPNFRKALFEQYKANRSAAPDDLKPQFARIEQLIEAMGIYSIRQSGMEADDLIATLAKRWLQESDRHKVVVVTGDKDLMQLVNGRVLVLDTMKEKVYGSPEVEEKFGVGPSSVRDYLALVGDSSDNIPGVPGIGPKSAEVLLKEHRTLEGVLAAAQAGKISGKKGDVIRETEKLARISYELVGLKDDLPVELDRNLAEYRFKLNEKTRALLKELEFHTLVERWHRVFGTGAQRGGESVAEPSAEIVHEGVPNVPSVAAAEQARFVCVTQKAEFEELLSAIVKKGEFAVDLETTSLNPRDAVIAGIALSVEPEVGYYVPIGHRVGEQLDASWVLEKLGPILANPKIKKVGQNLKYDWSVFLANGIEMDGIGADTMVAAYVLDPTGRHNFDWLCQKYLSYTPLSYEEVCGKGKDQITFDMVPLEQATRYSAEDAVYTLRLWHVLKTELERERLMPVFAEVDLPLVQVLGRMECHGVRVDTEYLTDLGRRFQIEIDHIEKEIGTHTPQPLNLNSPKQLAKFLFEDLKLPPQSKTKTGFSTDVTVLEALAPLHPVPKLLLEYREVAKLKGTYVDPIPAMIDQKDGRLHASFHQAGTATGRLSSSDPNLQNIPIRTERGRLIRRAFIPSKGNLLISADYSQIELRILAHMSGDQDLAESFRKDEDVHRRTASEIYGVSLEAVTESQRAAAKAINFGLMYGKGPFSLSQELGIPRKEAAQIIDRYFTRYSAVKKFLDGLIEGARNQGYVTTLLGRKRMLPEIHSKNHAVRNNAERMAMNTPIQGTAADLMKIAMIQLDEALRDQRFHAKLIIQVHDEVLLDCPEGEVDRVLPLVRGTLENALTLSVPLKVNAEAGKNWMEI